VIVRNVKRKKKGSKLQSDKREGILDVIKERTDTLKKKWKLQQGKK